MVRERSLIASFDSLAHVRCCLPQWSGGRSSVRGKHDLHGQLPAVRSKRQSSLCFLVRGCGGLSQGRIRKRIVDIGKSTTKRSLLILDRLVVDTRGHLG